jgi:hypothetical protein
MGESGDFMDIGRGVVVTNTGREERIDHTSSWTVSIRRFVALTDAEEESP